jgi:hypothetical protein
MDPARTSSGSRSTGASTVTLRPPSWTTFVQQ